MLANRYDGKPHQPHDQIEAEPSRSPGNQDLTFQPIRLDDCETISANRDRQVESFRFIVLHTITIRMRITALEFSSIRYIHT